MMYTKVRQVIDDLFCLTDRELGLKGGDVSPEDTLRLDIATEIIADVMNKWIKENK